MKTLKIVAVETDLRTAIEKSSYAFGLRLYASSEFHRKENNLRGVKEFYLVPNEINKKDLDIYYITTFLNKKTGRYRILHKFSWTSMLHNGGAGLCSIISDDNMDIKVTSGMENRKKVEAGDSIIIGDTKYERDQFRGNNYFWTC